LRSTLSKPESAIAVDDEEIDLFPHPIPEHPNLLGVVIVEGDNRAPLLITIEHIVKGQPQYLDTFARGLRQGSRLLVAICHGDVGMTR
jgi:hypothetical protein